MSLRKASEIYSIRTPLNRRPILCIIAGPNGSGKTTITRQLLKHEWGKDCIYVNPDNIAEEQYAGWNNLDSQLKAAQKAQEIRYSCLENKQNLVFETVMSSPEKLEFIRKAKEKGYFIRLFFVCTESPTINAARITQRLINGGHSVPIEKIVSRYLKSLKNLSEIIKEIDKCYLYDNSIDNQNAKLIFRTNNGQIEKIYLSDNEFPEWAKFIKNKLSPSEKLIKTFEQKR